MAFLTPALPQDLYVRINSVNIGDNAVAGRSFGGLVFTQGIGWAPTTGLTDDEGHTLTNEWDPDFLVVVHSADQAAKYFSSTSEELKAATRYFSFQKPSGAIPRTLIFAKVKDGEEPTEALKRICNGYTNFGSFYFLDPIKASDVVALAQKNAEYGNKYLYSQSAYGDAADSASEEVTDDSLTSEVSAKALNAYIRSKSETKFKGFVKIFGGDAISAQQPMALFDATDYNGAKTAANPMYKQYPGEPVVVVDVEEAKSLNDLNINYNARVQANGPSTVAFYQRGRNDDGEDTSVYCNEIWLRSAISAGILDLQLTTDRIDAGSEGEALIYSVIDSVARQGVTNGVITLGKTLTDAQKRRITQSTGDSSAWLTVQESGYWISIQIVQSDGTDGVTEPNDYKAVYKLVYSKGDSIKFVDGTDYLV